MSYSKIGSNGYNLLIWMKQNRFVCCHYQSFIYCCWQHKHLLHRYSFRNTNIPWWCVSNVVQYITPLPTSLTILNKSQIKNSAWHLHGIDALVFKIRGINRGEWVSLKTANTWIHCCYVVKKWGHLPSRVRSVTDLLTNRFLAVTANFLSSYVFSYWYFYC